ncbi:hypothetical protein ACFY6U_02450 [Streptomyces sp. NPDC013157]|uniref:hypothetical protein n=1 Tax=Streptomyces sp. NPDC013157 TaxID=3364861 RepID=UPI0036BCE30F
MATARAISCRSWSIPKSAPSTMRRSSGMATLQLDALAPALIGGTRIRPADVGEGGKLPAPIPVGRLGTPDEVAAMAVSMVTNGHPTNKVITLDGGLYPR